MNQYLEKIWDLSLKNQSAIDYLLLCELSLSRVGLEGYVERHHIFPKCLCDIDEEKKDSTNLVIFTAKEHFIAHKLLSEMFDGKIKRQMQKGLSMMLADRLGNRIFTPEEYEIARKANSASKTGVKLPPFTDEHLRNMSLSRKGKARSIKSIQKQSNTTKGRPLSQVQIDEYKRRIGKYTGPMKGKHHTSEAKEKMSAAGRGRLKTDEHKKKISDGNFGKKVSEESREKMSKSAKNKPKITCRHCGMSMITSNHTKWHGDKCKEKGHV